MSLVEFLIVLFITLGVLDKSKVQKILKYTSRLSTQQGRDVKISFEILKSIRNNRKFKSYYHNKVSIFDYSISINNSQIDVSLCPNHKLLSLFYKNLIGSFIHDYSIKFEASQVDIFAKIKIS